jgi:serine/threonine-protein kinase
MGALYLAVTGDRGLEKLCVIKTVLPHLADAEYVSRFRDEAKVVVKLSHGNLVPVFDAGQVGGELYLAMDFVEGKDLRAVWNRCAKKTVAFPVDVAVHIVKELCRGLGYAHQFGDLKLVHRDVSPPNVLISFVGEVRLTDFGLASSTLKLEKTAPGVIYGKVSYMSPEQARGEPLDGRTDLYAAGIILWELLTGRQLFPPGDQPQDLVARAKDPRIDPPSKRAPRVPPALDAIVLKALEPDQANRYQNGEEMRSALAEWLAREAPATDAARLEKFVTGLFAEDLPRERAEREGLIKKTRERITAPPTMEERLKLVPPDETRPAGPPSMPVSSSPQAVTDPPPRAAAVPSPGSGTRTPVAVPPPAAQGEGGPPVAAAPTGAARPEPTKRGVAVSVPPPGPGGATVVPTRPASDGAMSALAEKLDEDSFEDGAADPQEIVGQIVGDRYLVKSLIGEGGMGRVYEAEHIEIGKRVAIKILHPVYSRTPEVVARFRREARAASKIGHPNIVDVTDSGTTPDGSVFFVMEYLEGVELAAVIDREGALEVGRALGIGTQICRALAAAHNAGIIHRDLKPENVFLIVREGTTDFAKVLDFGIAKSAELEGQRKERLTHPGMAMGTPEYMAPEQAAGRPADARSDVYAVGAILYEMLTGRPPYEGENFMEILTKKATIEPVPAKQLRPDLPDVVEKVVMRAMSRDPADRPRSMEALEYELTKCLAGRGVAVAKMLGMPDAAVASAALGPLGEAAPMMGDEGAPGGHPGGTGSMRAFKATPPGLASSPPAVAGSAPPAVADDERSGPRPSTPMPVELSPEEKKKYRIGSRGASGWLWLFFFLVAGGAGAYWYEFMREPEKLPAAAMLGDAGAKAAKPVAVDAGTRKPERDKPAPERHDDKPPTADRHDDKPTQDKPVADKPTQDKPTQDKPTADKPSMSDKPPRDRKEALMLLRAARAAEAELKWAEARAYYERVAKGKFSRADGLLGIASIAWQTKDTDAAIDYAKKALDAGGGDAARMLLGHAYFKKGRFDDAIAMYQAVLKSDPKNTEAQRALRAAQEQKK